MDRRHAAWSLAASDRAIAAQRIQRARALTSAEQLDQTKRRLDRSYRRLGESEQRVGRGRMRRAPDLRVMA